MDDHTADANLSEHLSSPSRKRQFGAKSLMLVTAYIAVVITLWPSAYIAPFEVLCAAAFLLSIVAGILDFGRHTFARHRDTDFVSRRSVVILLLTFAVLHIGIDIFEDVVIRFPSYGLPARGRCDTAILLYVLGLILVIPSGRYVRLGKSRILLSYVGLSVIFATICWQVYQTSSQRYFIKRAVDSQVMREDGSIEMSEHAEELGAVGVEMRLSEHFPPWDRQDAFRPITKLRMLCSIESIEGLDFSFKVTPLDWRNLSSQSQLQYLQFNCLTITPKDCQVLRSLRNVQSLFFCACDLPDNWLDDCPRNLYHLGFSNCRLPDLNGLEHIAGLSALTSCNTTGLGAHHFDEIAKLHNLEHLDLREADLTSEMLVNYAARLSTSPPLGRKLLKLKLTFDPAIMPGIIALVRSGSVEQLELEECSLSDKEVTALEASDPKAIKVEIKRTKKLTFSR